MDKTPAPASFQQPTADAAATARHRKDQAPCGEFGCISYGANGAQVSAYCDPHGTVFIDRESHAGAWAKFFEHSQHGGNNA